MGYACPVCEVPQRDGKHLANHMAFTALLRHEDHEAWLDEHVDDWSDMGSVDLAGVVTDYAEETDFEEVFEDTTEGAGGHDDPHGPGHGHASGHARGAKNRGVQRSTGALDAEAQQIVREAQDLTRRMRADERSENEDGDDVGTDDDADTGDGVDQ